jgi:hypothetical protein
MTKITWDNEGRRLIDGQLASEHEAPDDALLDALHKTNDAIQDWVSEHGTPLPEEFLKLLSDLDWLLNGP